MPIRLWSTVVIQLHQPAVAFGRANTRRRGYRAGSASEATVAMLWATPPSSPSFQTVQILHERIDLFLGEHGPPGLPAGPDVHIVSRLDVLRIAQPVGKVRVGAIQDGSGEGRAIGEVREVGADDPQVGDP